MNDDQLEAAENPSAEALKKAQKAELKAEVKAAEKAKKAEAKAAKKLKKQKRKEAAITASTAQTGRDQIGQATAKPKKSKVKKDKSQSLTGASLSAKLQGLARMMRANLASQLLAHGLYAGQEQVLFLLDEHGPLALTELAEKLDVRAPTITKTVARMEGQSFLSRAVSRDDARSIIIALAPEGRRVLKICREIVVDVDAKAFSSLTKADCEGLEKTLDLVFSHMKHAE